MKKETKKELIKATVGEVMSIDSAIAGIKEQVPFALSIRIAALLSNIDHIVKSFRAAVDKLREEHLKNKSVDKFNAAVKAASETETEFEFKKFSIDEFKDMTVDKDFVYNLRKVINLD